MIAQSSRKNLPARDAVAYMAVRTNRRIIANAQTCVADIKEQEKVTSAEQRTAYFWMILQPFLSIDDFRNGDAFRESAKGFGATVNRCFRHNRLS